MISKLVWVADQGCGGWGDRMVGLASAYFIARATNRRLYIWWRYPDMSSTITVKSEYNYIPSLQSTITIIDWIDRGQAIQNELSKKQHFQTILIKCNENLYSKLPTVWIPTSPQVRECYQSLLTRFFELNASLQKEIQGYETPDVAFQIRLGDHQVRRFHGSGGNPDPKGLEGVLKQVGLVLQQMNPRSIYFASDCDANLCLPILRQYCKGNIMSCPLQVEHIDRTAAPTTEGFRKLLIDFVMMSRCSRFLIPWHSNLSRVAVLSSKTMDLDGFIYCQPLDSHHLYTFERIVDEHGSKLLETKGGKPSVRIN